MRLPPLTRSSPAIVALAIVGVCAACFGEREPSEAEMRAAYGKLIEGINAELQSKIDACHAGDYRSDPLLAIQCLGILAASGGRKQLSFEITRFEKLGCAKATSQPGYTCDFIAGTRSDSPLLQGEIARLTGRGEAIQGRFLRRDDGWVYLRE